jgi:hypothetical protein
MKRSVSLTLVAHLVIGSVSLLYGGVRPINMTDSKKLKGTGQLPISDRNEQRKSPDEIWRAIKAFGISKAESNSTINIKNVGASQVELVKRTVGDLGFGSDPYRVPFEKQLTIEALRRALSESPWSKSSDNKRSGSLTKDKKSVTPAKESQPDRLWESYLKPAEALVRQSIKDIEGAADVNVLKKKLERIEGEIDTILFENLFDAIERRAKKFGYNIIFGRGDNAKKFSVSVSSVPGGARVFVMTDVVYQKQLILNVDSKAWPWLELVQNPASLLGKYRYMAIWPDGSRSEGNFEIINASPLELKR